MLAFSGLAGAVVYAAKFLSRDSHNYPAAPFDAQVAVASLLALSPIAAVLLFGMLHARRRAALVCDDCRHFVEVVPKLRTIVDATEWTLDPPRREPS